MNSAVDRVSRTSGFGAPPDRVQRSRCWWWALTMLLSTGVVQARAQLVDQYFPAALPGYESDLTLPMQVYDPRVAAGRGVQLGDFNLEPSLTESAGYNSNPLGDGGRGSSLLETNASVSLGSDWARDALNATLDVDDTNYFDQPLASNTSWQAALGGAVDIGRTRVDAAYSHLAEYLTPTSLGVLGVTAPVPFAVDDVRLDDNLTFGRVRLIPAFEFENFSFGQSGAVSGGVVPSDYTTISHQNFIGTLTGLFELSTGRSIVAIIRGASAQYGVPAIGGQTSNYGDILGFTGIDFQTAALIRIRALLGAETRAFAASFSPTITTPAAELDVIWEPTRLTTVITSVSRRLEDATSPFASSETVTEGRLEIDHSLRRNIALTGFLDVGSSDFAGNGQQTASNQLQTNVGFTARWTINRHVSLQLGYTYNENNQSGSLQAPGFFIKPRETINVVSLGLMIAE